MLITGGYARAMWLTIIEHAQDTVTVPSKLVGVTRMESNPQHCVHTEQLRTSTEKLEFLLLNNCINCGYNYYIIIHAYNDQSEFY